MLFPLLHGAMRQRRMTQYDLATKLAISEGTLSKKLNGKAELDPHERNRVVELLGKPEGFLFMTVEQILELASEGVIRQAPTPPDLWAEFITTAEFREWYEGERDILECEALYRSFVKGKKTASEVRSESTGVSA